jgi:hypothetical protein
MNETEIVMVKLGAKETRYQEIQSKLDQIKALVLKTGEDAIFVDYTVNEVSKNKLVVEIFGMKYFIFFENSFSKGNITYSEVDNDGFRDKDVQTIVVDKLGNLKPYELIPASKFNDAHYATLNSITNDAFQKT